MKFFSKRNINGKLFLTLWIACAAGHLLAVPYGLELQQEALAKLTIPLSRIILIQLAINIVLYALLIFTGLIMIRKTPYKFAILGNTQKINIKKNVLFSIAGGILVFALIGLSSWLIKVFFGDIESGKVLEQPAVWKGFLASFYGAINEEVLLRLLVMTGITFGLTKIKSLRDDRFSSPIAWFAILVSAVVFGIGHIPAALGIGMELDIELIIRILIPNTVGGIVFGYIYWKKGFEYAVVTHFTTDILLHCVLPVFKTLSAN